MKRNEYYERVHKKELKSLTEIFNRIKKGLFLISSVNFTKDMSGDGYRLIVRMMERQ